jgi:NitT/TauT family transport system substrate-binding protein
MKVGRLFRAMPRLFCFAASLAFAGPAFAQTKISVGDVGSGSATHWPAYIAIEKGFFRDVGLSVEYVSAPSSSSVMQQLAAGSLDFGSGGLVDPIRAIDKGAPIVLFRTEAVVAPYEVFGKSTIKTLADLKGKTAMIGGPKDITRIYLERMLAGAGVKPGEVDYIYAGATAARFAALVAGSIDATILNPPFNFKARGAGLTPLGAAADTTRDFPFTGYAVSRPWATAHKGQLAGFMTAYARGVAWFYDPANRIEAGDIAAKYFKVDRSDIDQTYDFFQRLKIFDASGAIAGSGIENLLAILKNFGDLEGAAGVARFVDPSLTGKP